MGIRNLHIGIILFGLTMPLVAYGQSKANYEVEIVPVSSDVFSDIAPVIVQDGIIFCSTRKSSIIKDFKTYDGNRLYDIYFAKLIEDGKFEKPKKFSNDLSSVFNEGPLCFSPDGKTLYFTRNVELGKRSLKRKNSNSIGIFISEKRGDSWVNLKPFEHNNTAYNIGHPSLSPDGKKLFFSSNKPGGMGGYDIYYCELIDNKWGTPINAG